MQQKPFVFGKYPKIPCLTNYSLFKILILQCISMATIIKKRVIKPAGVSTQPRLVKKNFLIMLVANNHALSIINCDKIKIFALLKIFRIICILLRKINLIYHVRHIKVYKK